MAVPETVLLLVAVGNTSLLSLQTDDNQTPPPEYKVVVARRINHFDTVDGLLEAAEAPLYKEVILGRHAVSSKYVRYAYWPVGWADAWGYAELKGWEDVMDAAAEERKEGVTGG